MQDERAVEGYAGYREPAEFRTAVSIVLEVIIPLLRSSSWDLRYWHQWAFVTMLWKIQTTLFGLLSHQDTVSLTMVRANLEADPIEALCTMNTKRGLLFPRCLCFMTPYVTSTRSECYGQSNLGIDLFKACTGVLRL